MTKEQAGFLHELVPAAQRVAARYGLPASVLLAQAILESNWGRSRLARRAKNLFGIKAAERHTESLRLPTCEYDAPEAGARGKPRVVVEAFALFATLEDCLADYARLLAFAPRYRPARAVANDPFAFAEELEACGYATDPGYARKLARLLRVHQLTQYDIPEAKEAQEEAAKKT